MPSTITIQYHEIEQFQFQHESSPPASVRVAYLEINPTAKKTALVVSCFRGRLHTTLNFATGALKDYRVIVVALFGNGESSSPSNMPAPSVKFDYRDCVRAQRDLLISELGIEKLDVIVGFSMGGQCAYYWTLMYPEMVRNAVMICSSARTSRHNYQFLEGPKAAMENSRDYLDKEPAVKSKKHSEHGGLRALGKAYSAWLTSAEWFDQQKYKSLGYDTLEDWDREMTSNQDWHPEDLLSKIRMWQAGDVTKLLDERVEGEDEEASLARALIQIQARVLLMPCDADQYFRWEVSEKEARYIGPARATLRVIPSVWGHMAGLGGDGADRDWMDKQIAAFLAAGQ